MGQMPSSTTEADFETSQQLNNNERASARIQIAGNPKTLTIATLFWMQLIFPNFIES